MDRNTSKRLLSLSLLHGHPMKNTLDPLLSEKPKLHPLCIKSVNRFNASGESPITTTLQSPSGGTISPYTIRSLTTTLYSGSLLNFSHSLYISSQRSSCSILNAKTAPPFGYTKSNMFTDSNLVLFTKSFLKRTTLILQTSSLIRLIHNRLSTWQYLGQRGLYLMNSLLSHTLRIQRL